MAGRTMKLLVAVKQIAALDEDFELSAAGDTTIDPEFLEWDLNEWDAFSLEAALQIQDEAGGDGTEVVVVSVGEEPAEEGLLDCLAKGADRAIRVWDEMLAAGDTLATARVLAAVVEREAPDLVLCGVQSSDTASGATGAAVAGFLGLPHVAVVKRIDYDARTAIVSVTRELEGGLSEELRIGTPALLTVQTGINEPRYANLRAIKQARQKPLDVMGMTDLALDPTDVVSASGGRLVALTSPERLAGAEMLEGPPAAIAARIIEIARERGGE
jgi:electron transfer flavoprotein beta subunit